MEKCIGCNCMTADLVCLLDGQEKDDIELSMPVANCDLLADYKRNYDKIPVGDTKQKVVSFDAEVTAGDHKYSASISKDKNKLVLEFAGTVPYPILSSKAGFHVKLEIPAERVDCINDCDHCITSIC